MWTISREKKIHLLEGPFFKFFCYKTKKNPTPNQHLCSCSCSCWCSFTCYYTCTFSRPCPLCSHPFYIHVHGHVQDVMFIYSHMCVCVHCPCPRTCPCPCPCPCPCLCPFRYPCPWPCRSPNLGSCSCSRPRSGRQDRTAGTRQHGQDSRKETAAAGKPGQEKKDRMVNNSRESVFF